MNLVGFRLGDRQIPVAARQFVPKMIGAARANSGGPSEAPRAGLEPATNRLHRLPPFPTGVDYLITVGREGL